MRSPWRDSFFLPLSGIRRIIVSSKLLQPLLEAAPANERFSRDVQPTGNHSEGPAPPWDLAHVLPQGIKCQVDFQNVYKLDAEHAAKWRDGIVLKQLFDSLLSVWQVLFSFCGPSSGDAIKLIKRVIECDVRIQSRSRGHHHIGGYGLNV